MTSDPSTRARVLELLRDGLVTHTEAANYLGISRQAVRDMCLRAKVDAPMARHRYLRKLLEGAPIKRRTM